VQALANIKLHVSQINSPEIYMEQTIYKHINAVVSSAHGGFRFQE
jgi:hypothetical protein